MSATKSAQGSVRITRLRNGDSLLATLYSDKPLFQALSDGGGVSPDWETASNQPTVKPELYSSMGSAVSVRGFEWFYNGVKIEFGDADGDGWATEKTGTTWNPGSKPRFKVMSTLAMATKDTPLGTLRIIDNLAGNGNEDNDILRFEGGVETNGVTQKVTASIDVMIQKMGASAYQGLITVSPSNTFSKDVGEITLTPSLVGGAGSSTGGYQVKWYHDVVDIGKTEISSEVGKFDIKGNVLKVQRDGVDATELFIAVFEINSVEVSRYAVTLTDTTDEYHISFKITDSNNENNAHAAQIASAGDSLKVIASVVDRNSSPIVFPSDAKPEWVMRVMNHDAWTEVKSDTMQSPTGSIIVSDADTDDGKGNMYDVEVTAEVSW